MVSTTSANREQAARKRAEAFAQKFGGEHLLLACHAAFPLVLTPDLLYQIWANFVPEAPWTAVARVLLSVLCREVGYEMYEMDLAVRNLLLRELKADGRFGLRRWEELADFLIYYVEERLTGEDLDTRDLAQAQQWTALAYAKPDEAARKLAEALRERVKRLVSRAEPEEEGEVLRLASLVETFAEPLQEEGFEPLLIYAGGIDRFVRGDAEGAKAQFEKLDVEDAQVKIAGVSLDIPSVQPIVAEGQIADKEGEAIGLGESLDKLGDANNRGKSVFIHIGEGSFEAGFPVAMRLWEDGQVPSIGISGRLPPAPEIPEIYRTWQIACMMQVGRMKAKPGFPTNVSPSNSSQALKASINLWLDSEEFRPIRDKLLEKLSPEDEVLAIFQADDPLLWRLPWHLWDLFDRYYNVEVALSTSQIEQISVARKPKSQKEPVKILAILGDSKGIDIERDRALLEELPDAEVTFLVEPEVSDLNDRLWKGPWDILFFAGHSLTEDDVTGKIFINEKDSLSVGELKYALRQAIRQGLKIAIFNSCDGLGLAKELADLHIPQTVVMREPVADPVAQEFLKHFLNAFSGGKSFHLAVREARERLQGLENRFPSASWLPAIWQNPGARALRWQDLTGEADLKKGNNAKDYLMPIFQAEGGLDFIGDRDPSELKTPLFALVYSKFETEGIQGLIKKFQKDTSDANRQRLLEELKEHIAEDEGFAKRLFALVKQLERAGEVESVDYLMSIFQAEGGLDFIGDHNRYPSGLREQLFAVIYTRFEKEGMRGLIQKFQKDPSETNRRKLLEELEEQIVEDEEFAKKLVALVKQLARASEGG